MYLKGQSYKQLVDAAVLVPLYSTVMINLGNFLSLKLENST